MQGLQVVPRQHHSREVHHYAALQSVWTGKGRVRRSKRMGCNLTARSISSFLLIVIVYCVQVMNKAGNSSLCLDFLQKNEHKTYKLGQYPCHSKLYSSQVLVDVLLLKTSRWWCWECNGNGFSMSMWHSASRWPSTDSCGGRRPVPRSAWWTITDPRRKHRCPWRWLAVLWAQHRT